MIKKDKQVVLCVRFSTIKTFGGHRHFGPSRKRRRLTSFHKEEVTQGNYKQHSFAKERPDLMNSIESLGNYISQEILLNKELGAVKQWLTDVKWTS
jgi:hypothetical protein